MRNLLHIILSTFFAIQAIAGIEKGKTEKEILSEPQMLNCFKRATIVSEFNSYHVYSGGVGSGRRIYNAYIFKETKEGFFLECSVQQTRPATYGIYPSINKQSIELISYGRDWEETLATFEIKH